MGIFLGGLVALGLGYLFYGRLLVSAIGIDPKRPTPAITRPDGIDFVPLSSWRVFLIQLLNIAGLGPVFGPIMGALWGPQVLLWIVLGAIFGGAVHDLLSGAMSLRREGAGLPDLIGEHLGRWPRQFATFFILLLMVLVGTVFVKGPAKLITQLLPATTVGSWFSPELSAWLSGSAGGQQIWLWVVMAAIFLYYVAATMLPIDKIIGRIYPIFAAALLVMVAGLAYAMLFGSLAAPPLTLENLHPRGVAAWPVIFITVSCGAISGFHATQSPMMARCIRSEAHIKPIFYGAMIAEGLIALIWASAAQSFFGGVGGLAKALGPGLNNTAVVVHQICVGTMGSVGGMLAVLGVVVLPITSGDTAFRVARLIVADYSGLPQSRARNRYLISLPLFALAFALNWVPFGVIWRYFGWANQTLAAVSLWTGAVFLAKQGRAYWIAALPATFMTVMVSTYLLVDVQAGFGLAIRTGTLVGCALGGLALAIFFRKLPGWARGNDLPRS